MKKFINLFYLLFVFAVFGYENKNTAAGTFKDSIIVFFSPIFSSHNYSPKELLIRSKKNQVSDTVFMSKKDFISIKNYIQKQIPLTTKVKGVPEMLIKSGNKSIFLVRLSKRYTTDVEGRALIPNKKIIQLINDSIKVYNYFYKDDILLGDMYEKVPQDYKYYRKSGDNRYLKDSGIKILIIER